MKIKFTNFNDGIHHFNFVENIIDLGLDDRFSGKLKVNCKMDKSHHQIVVDCDLLFNAELTCDRCLQEFSNEFLKHFQNIYFIVYEKGKEEVQDPGIYYITPTQDKIDLSADVSEIIKISIPMKILCGEECKGLCSKCGKNLNDDSCDCIDHEENPVWESLKKLKGNLN